MTKAKFNVEDAGLLKVQSEKLHNISQRLVPMTCVHTDLKAGAKISQPLVLQWTYSRHACGRGGRDVTTRRDYAHCE